MVIQETHSSVEIEKIWRNEWGGEIIFSHGTTAARGIAVCVTKQIFEQISQVETDQDGRSILFNIITDSTKISVMAIYAPNTDSPLFFKQMSDKLKQRHEHKIIVGDFNLVLDVEKDRLNTYNNNNKALEKLEDMMDEYCLRDVWRIQNEEKLEYSWRKTGSLNKASRIDFALVTGGLDQQVKCIMYIPGIQTDHRALYMLVEVKDFDRGLGFWKLNTQLLQDEKYLSLIRQEIVSSITASAQKDFKEIWEIIKKRVKKVTVDYSKSKVREDKLVIGELSEIINDYESSLPLNKNEDQLLQNTKADLEEKLLERVKGIMFRSKVKWFEEGERSSKYFFSLEKARYNSKTCFKIISENGEEFVQPHQILQVQQEFYQNLYGVDTDVNFTLSNNYGIHVPNDIRESQNSQITLEELAQAVKQMKNGKTPGEDGLPIEFYKIFWADIKYIFHQMMELCYQEEQLHSSARKGILKPYPKANKDTRYVKNLRPITLLNVDYKIIEKAIANKMVPALEHIINKDQRGFMKERRISVNIRKMLDIIHEAEKEDLEALVLSMDFVKCFDKCSFSILHGSLEFFNFGEVVKVWTKILYKDFSVKIQNNGFFSSKINIEKGVHQGGCCSSIYFLVIAEILALSLRNNQDIDGLTFGQIKNLLNQFADDMDIFSICNQKSITAICRELQEFYYQSGFEVSYDKTTLYRIGSLRESEAKRYDTKNLKWTDGDINVLGVTITQDSLEEKNYGSMKDKCSCLLNKWDNRGLSLIGKVQVVNTLVASLLCTR